MKKIWAVFKKDLFTFFVSPAAYFALTGYFVLGGYLFFSFLAGYNDALANFARMTVEARGRLNLNDWVIARYYHALVFLMVFLVPLLAMRSIAEERRRGTFELLCTSPLTSLQIVAAKFLALAGVVSLMSLAASLFPLMLCLISEPEVPPIISGMFGMMLCGLAFSALALAASSVTDNHVVAAISGTALLFLLYVVFFPAKSLGPSGEAVLMYVSPMWQVNGFLEGVISLKSVIYFLSMTAFGLVLSCRLLAQCRRG